MTYSVTHTKGSSSTPSYTMTLPTKGGLLSTRNDVSHKDTTQSLFQRLKGQQLVIPDLRPMFSHWSSGTNEHYMRMKESVDKKLSLILPSEKHQKAVSDADPALLAAKWWPTSSWERYQTMTDLVIWFGIWDDYVEKLACPLAAQDFRVATKKFVTQSLGLARRTEAPAAPVHPLIQSFKGIADEVCKAFDLEQREQLLKHFDQYIDATELEAEFEKAETVPGLDQYWEVRTLTSGMGTLLGMSEFALQVKLPMHIITSPAYETLWAVTIVINSIVNDLISFKKEMAAGSVLSSVAILFHQSGDLDLAVKLSVEYLQQLVDLYDTTAEVLLQEAAAGQDAEVQQAVSEVVDLFRMVNTGNLEWSLGAKRYGVNEFIQEDGSIELYL
ncbi:uncharacterized protein JN550_008206 [Neoarthrinium moseri]|uniref:uncharacterized protein n=1 Tax=Neoarthrinium moseri TaxID=1658444 RepID=UPI001FDB2B67|nr:uncharacterized protein JN550_008206 [Neoarthrinium moseri]KAI1865449.1 hypothetical protein JN550_008206 [Neoarthrinium moseri]